MASDDTIIQNLPLPLAHLLRRAANAKAASDRLLTSYYAWEASLKLLGSVAIIEYVALGRHDADIDDLLKNLARPTIGRWWEFARRLLPVLADSGDVGFAQSRKLILGRTRDDLPFAAGLDGALRESLTEDRVHRTTVRLTELFNRLVAWRNRELGHGAACQKGDDDNQRLGRAMFSGVRDLLGKIDVLAGRRLLFVTDVHADSFGNWVVESLELRGESPKRIEPVVVPRSETSFPVRPNRVYVARTMPDRSVPASSPLDMHCLHPLMLFDEDEQECLFMNARRGQRKAEYLCYTTGRHIDQDVLETDRRELLVRVLGGSVDGQDLASWEAPEADQGPAAQEQETPAHSLGEFELLSKIGQGGMGIVYRAWQPSLGRQVAVKSLIRSGEPDAEFRFAREIRVLGRVEHPNVVKIYTSGVDGDNWYFAMELVEGAALSEVQGLLADQSAADIRTPQWQQALSTACEHARARERSLSSGSHSGTTTGSVSERPVPDSSQDEDLAAPAISAPVEHIVIMMRQAAEATQALHTHGIVHRDIKPGNIMISSDGKRAVLMDLGLAQLADASEGQLTRTRQFVGTLRYASPEQIVCSRELDPRSDVYSLGATLWELLTLQPLYGATDETSPHELMVAIQQKPLERIRTFNPSVPSDLEAIVFKCLEKDRHRRYETAGELADDLQRWQQGDAVHARRLTPWYFLERKVARNRKRLAWTGGGALAIAALFWLLLPIFAPTPDDTPLRMECERTVQTLPGLNGGWWFDESPWLIPPVRNAIAREIVQDKLPCDGILESAKNGDRAQVRNVMRSAWEETLDRQAQDQQVKWKHLVVRLDGLTRTDLSPIGTQQILRSILDETADGDTPPALHTRAVLYHQLAKLDRSDKTLFQRNVTRAQRCYQQAEDGYEADCPLRYLCLLDHALLLGMQLFDDAGNLQDDNLAELNRRFTEASRWQDGPAVFQVYARLAHATTLLAAKQYERADKLFDTTLGVAASRKLDKRRELTGHPLVASTHEQYAWSLMDQWRVDDAASHFEQAAEIRDKLADSGDEAAWQHYYHDLHGLAMAKRYCGKRREAQKRYQALVGLDGESGFAGRKLHEIRDLVEPSGASLGYLTRALETRLQNSCERYADCTLYAWSPTAAAEPAFIKDLQHAALLYGKSQKLAAELDSTTCATMGYKRALTLLLLGETDEANSVLLALQENASNVVVSSDSYARRVLNLRQVVDAIREPTFERQQKALRKFLSGMEADRDKPANDNRDTFELRLLCAKRLLCNRPGDDTETVGSPDALSYIATVLRDISDKRDKADDGEFRDFLRDYWNLALDAVQEMYPAETSKRLVKRDGEHWMWKEGEPGSVLDAEGESPRPILAISLPRGNGMDGLAILMDPIPDSPYPNLRFFPLSFGWTEVTLANQTGLRLRVPDKLQRYIRRRDMLAGGLALWAGNSGDFTLKLPLDLQEFQTTIVTSSPEEHTQVNAEAAPDIAP